MTKNKQEIKELKQEITLLGIAFLIIIFAFIFTNIRIDNIKQELSSVPYKVCENVQEETKLKGNFTNFDAIEIMQLSEGKIQCYYGVKGFNWTYDYDGRNYTSYKIDTEKIICSFMKTKEVCHYE
jgi:hypothetical protein